MFLLARKIKSLGVKMVLSGEGADEIFGGYLYFHKSVPASPSFAKRLYIHARMAPMITMVTVCSVPVPRCILVLGISIQGPQCE